MNVFNQILEKPWLCFIIYVIGVIVGYQTILGFFLCFLLFNTFLAPLHRSKVILGVILPIIFFWIKTRSMPILYICQILPPLVLSLHLKLYKLEGGKERWYPLDDAVNRTILIGFLALFLNTFFFKPIDFSAIEMIQNSIDMRKVMEKLTFIFPVIFQISVLSFTLTFYYLCQKWSPLRPKSQTYFSQLKLHPGFWIGGCVVGFLYLISPLTFINYTVIGSMACLFFWVFFLQGLAVVHFFAKKIEETYLVLGIFYVFMLYSHIVIMIVMLVGLLEPWVVFRQRILKGDN
jgi:hypothetical protein